MADEITVIVEETTEVVNVVVQEKGVKGDPGPNDHSGLNLDDGTNPHGTTKTDVGLGSADNTADADKEVSTPQQEALDLKADKSNVLELDNTTPFTPVNDYEPATKKYVDDNAGGGGNTYELPFRVDSGSVLNWMGKSSTTSDIEWNKNTVKSGSTSMITVSTTELFATDQIFVARATETIKTMSIFVGFRGANLKQLSLLKATFDNNYVTINSIAVLYENLSTNQFTVGADGWLHFNILDFDDLNLIKDNIIFAWFVSSTTNDVLQGWLRITT